jgi:hypothetical protein
MMEGNRTAKLRNNAFKDHLQRIRSFNSIPVLCLFEKKMYALPITVTGLSRRDWDIRPEGSDFN